MSKKLQKNPKKGTEKKEGAFPLCLNKNEARMVCLSEQCQQYPFFCSICEESQCEIAHRHEDKLISVSFKEFTKRVLRERKPIDPLNKAMESYKKVLEKLKQDVSQFIEKELGQLEEISKRAEEIPEDDQEIIGKLKAQQYEGTTGAMMDALWTNCAEDPQKQKTQEETAEFIKIKEEEVKGISEHFQHLNQMDYDNIPQEDEQKEKGKGKGKGKEKQQTGKGKNDKKQISNSGDGKTKK